MKTSRAPLPLLALLALGLPFPLSAQEAARPVPPAATDHARELFLSGQDAAAEKRLTDRNRNPKQTAEWHLESANELVQMAFSLTRAGQPERAAQVARRALAHTEQAVRLARRPALAASAEETAAFIQEKLLADHEAAKAAYRAAARRHPRGGAANELQRLERIEQAAERKAARRNR